jgi:chitodextrinase
VRKIMIFIACIMLVSTLFVIVPETVSADLESNGYFYTLDGNDAMITGYNGSGGAISIPSTLNGHPTIVINDSAFNSAKGHTITSVIIPDSVTTIGTEAFRSCNQLTSADIGTGFVTGGFRIFIHDYHLISIILRGSATGDMCTCWVDDTNSQIRGHAYSTSDFPAPGNTYFHLMMGEYIPANGNPVFGIPSPVNGSTGTPLSFSWDISINDPEGNTFTWTIQCSNGQHNNGTGVSNGTKSLALSGLTSSKNYTVWVNATDPTGSGLYTLRWYQFTTQAVVNTPPVFGVPSPTNGSTGNPLSLSWSIPINDSQGDVFSWTIQCSNGQANSGPDASNGTKSLSLSGLAYSTMYKIWVNATDPTGSNQWTQRWYTFTTSGAPPPPPPDDINTPPVADLSAGGPYQGFVNSELTFDGSKSSDSDGTILSWSWNFGDGTNGSGKIITHVYTTPGTYQVNLTVTDNDRAINTDTSAVILKVNNPPYSTDNNRTCIWA